jgi:hypothetical protein
VGVVDRDALDARPVVGDARDTGAGADALPADGVGGGLGDLAVAVLGVVEGAVEVACLRLRTAEGLQEEGLQVEALQAIPGHAGRKRIGVGAP